jgi:hypothetical protein
MVFCYVWCDVSVTIAPFIFLLFYHEIEKERECPQILAQLIEMSKLLVSDVMTGIRFSAPPFCVCMACHFVYVAKKKEKERE